MKGKMRLSVVEKFYVKDILECMLENTWCVDGNILRKTSLLTHSIPEDFRAKGPWIRDSFSKLAAVAKVNQY